MEQDEQIDKGGILPAQEPPARKKPTVSTSSKVKPAKKETKVAEQDATITNEDFAAQMRLLAARARAAGLNPIRALLQAYGVLGMGVLEGLLLSLENVGNPKKKKKR